jgi:hypothetical protein
MGATGGQSASLEQRGTQLPIGAAVEVELDVGDAARRHSDVGEGRIRDA